MMKHKFLTAFSGNNPKPDDFSLHMERIESVLSMDELAKAHQTSRIEMHFIVDEIEIDVPPTP